MGPASVSFLFLMCLLNSAPVFTQNVLGPESEADMEFGNMVKQVVDLPKQEEGLQQEFNIKMEEVKSQTLLNDKTTSKAIPAGMSTISGGPIENSGSTLSPNPNATIWPNINGNVTGSMSQSSMEPTGSEGGGDGMSSVRTPAPDWGAKRIIGLSTCAILLMSIILLISWDMCCRRGQ